MRLYNVTTKFGTEKTSGISVFRNRGKTHQITITSNRDRNRKFGSQDIFTEMLGRHLRWSMRLYNVTTKFGTEKVV